VDDARHGPLVNGPTYPESYNAFDGQGIPDAFQPHIQVEGGLALGIGIGLIDTRSKIVEPCMWSIEIEPRSTSVAYRATRPGLRLHIGIRFENEAGYL
jgi:hypothetical protein